MPRTYTEFAEANGVELPDGGPCPFCGADFERGVHACVEVFELGFGVLDLSAPEDHRYRFFIVDAHALQHPELHGRWSDHFHLARLELVLGRGVAWSYSMSPRMSRALDAYKLGAPDEVLEVPPPGERGEVTAARVRAAQDDPEACRAVIVDWASSVLEARSAAKEAITELVALAEPGLHG